MLKPVADGVWVAEMPNRFFGLEFGARMTIVRLSDGSLFMHSPIAIDDSMKAEIDQIGPVAHIVAPNVYHHLYAKPASALYPHAKVHLARALTKKRSDLRVDSVLGSGSDPSWGDDLEAISVDGFMLNETVFVHQPSGTLLCSDLIENFQTSDDWFTRTFLKLTGALGKAGVSLPLRLAYRDKRAGRRSVDAILDRPFDKVVQAHGDPILQDGRDVLRDSYTWLSA